MVKVGKWIAKHRILMLIIGFLLIIPSVIGMAATKVNYDLLSYLPEHVISTKTVSAVSNKAMEASLKLNGIPDGKKSYGRMVNLLLEYHYCIEGK